MGTLSVSLATAAVLVEFFFGKAGERVGWNLAPVADQAFRPCADRTVGMSGQGVVV